MEPKRVVILSSFIIRIVFYFFCLAGCAYQIRGIFRIYFSYQTTIEVKLRRPTTFDVPSISVCFNLTHIVDQEKLSERGITLEHLSNLTIQERNSLTKNFKHLASTGDKEESCWVLEPETYSYNNSTSLSNKSGYAHCTRVSEPTVKYFGPYKCFTFFSEALQVDSTSAISEIFIRLLIRENLCTSMLVFFDDPNGETLSFDEGNWLGLDICKFNSYIIGYSKSIRKLLQAPHETNCTNYKTDTGASTTRSGCFRDCLAKRYKEMDLWPALVPAPPDVPLRLYTPPEDLGSYDTVQAASLEKQCLDHCGTNEDCYKVSYHVKELFKKHRDPKDNKQSKITINIPYGLEEMQQHNPKLDWIECVCYLGAAISLWFGASLVTLADVRWLQQIHNALHPKIPFGAGTNA